MSEKSGEYLQPGSNFLKQNLNRFGVGSNDPFFSSLVSKHLYGEDSPVYQHYLELQGPGENWCEFPPSCSPFQVQRVLSGQSARRSVCIAVGRAFTEVTVLAAPELATDPLPFMQLLQAALAQRVALAVEKPINDLLEPPEFHYARLSPLKNKDISQVLVTAVSQSKAKIEVVFRSTPIQVGLILHTPHHDSVIYAPQPYRWTGAEVVVGRKKIRYIDLAPERVESAVASYLKSLEHVETVAS